MTERRKQVRPAPGRPSRPGTCAIQIRYPDDPQWFYVNARGGADRRRLNAWTAHLEQARDYAETVTARHPLMIGELRIVWYDSGEPVAERDPRGPVDNPADKSGR